MGSVMDLDQLRTLSELKFQRSQQAVSGLLQRENALRAELVRLRGLAQETQTQPPEQAQMRMIGGDVIWLKWLGRAQQELNMELAQVLAKKEALAAQHRKNHGRKMVAERLADREIEERRQSKQKLQLDKAINHSLLR